MAQLGFKDARPDSSNTIDSSCHVFILDGYPIYPKLSGLLFDEGPAYIQKRRTAANCEDMDLWTTLSWVRDFAPLGRNFKFFDVVNVWPWLRIHESDCHKRLAGTFRQIVPVTSSYEIVPLLPARPLIVHIHFDKMCKFLLEASGVEYPDRLLRQHDGDAWCILLHNYSWNILDAQVLSLMVIAVAITLKDEFCRTLTTVHSHLAEQDLRECKDC